MTTIATCQRLDEATAYVLGALSEHQRELYARHARVCDVCAEELELLNEAAFVPEVMVSRPVKPPSEHEHYNPSRPVPAEHAQSGARAGTTGAAAHRSASRRSRRRLAPPIPKPALTALLGLLLVAAMTVYMSNRVLSTTYARGSTAWPQTAGVALQLQGGSGELLLNHVPAAPSGMHYEIWALPQRGTTLQRFNVPLTLNSDGQAGVKLPGDIHDFRAVGVYPVAGAGGTANGGASSLTPARTMTVSDHPVAVVYVPQAAKK